MNGRSNIPDLTVSELALSLKRTLEDTYARVRVRGELSKVKIHTSGHMYSDLKDADAVLNIICWKGTLGKLSLKPEEGLDVICTGRITSYPARSNYQMIVEEMELAGVGALLKMLEDRKKRLAAEGLFDAARKKPLPPFPETIGVVTSPTGAVIRDILHRLIDRFPCRVLVWPVRVQGEGAADEITDAINGFNAMATPPDILIVARGGGSIEDLMPFNEENVVRAAAASRIPLISAVGHETDTTLIDFASDIRAPTPTAAAELAVPERLALLAYTADSGARLTNSLRRRFVAERDRLTHIAARMGRPARLLDTPLQRLSHAATRIDLGFTRRLQAHHQGLTRLTARLITPQHLLTLSVQKLTSRGEKLAHAANRLVADKTARLEHLGKLAEILSFKATLNRGFALVRDSRNNPVMRRAGLESGQSVSIEFADGRIKSIVEENS